jgi:hypothetical protein
LTTFQRAKIVIQMTKNHYYRKRKAKLVKNRKRKRKRRRRKKRRERLGYSQSK